MSKIKTSVYIKKSLLKLLNEKAHSTKVKKNVLVSKLFIAIKDNRQLPVKQYRTVKYQDDDIKSNWKIHRINIEQEIYKVCIDMRNVYMVSVSWILAYAISMYLDDILDRKKRDNYSVIHTFIHHTSDNIFGFTVYFGKPPT